MDRTEIIGGPVIPEGAVIPTAALVAIPTIAIAIINAAVVADLGTPITIVKDVGPVVPTPIRRGP
jgi:hypothetical protein